jgi:uncharacterized repeat protein (TIGR01451 family)
MKRISGKRVHRKSLTRVAMMLALTLAIVGSGAGALAAATFGKGDVFVGVSGGQTQWHNPDGSLVKTLDDTTGSFTTGMAFDSSGNLYVTDFSGGGEHHNGARPAGPKVRGGGGVGTVSVFDDTGKLTGTFGSGYANPESILFDKSGNAYVGNAGGDFVLKFNGSGNLLDTFTMATEDRGTDWIDLAADQCTLFYTSEGHLVKRFNVCTNKQLSDFASGLGGSAAYALRLLPSGGALVADSQTIVRLDSGGNVIKSYDATGEDSWFALNLDPDGTSFWSADFGTGDVKKFNIASGNVLESFNTGTGGDTVFGLGVFGEITVGGGGADLSIKKTDAPDPVLAGDLLTYTIKVTNNGADTAKDVVVTDKLPSGVTLDSASTSCSGTSTITCSLGTIANGNSDSVLIKVVPSTAGTIKNTATVSSSTNDPNTKNNSSTATTTVNPAPGGGVQTGAGGTARRSGLLAIVLVVLLLVVAGLGVRRRAKA